jgi:methylated-DNA-[protein]-cysteine S-methyltransferase
MTQLSMESPVGPLTVSEVDGAIVAVDWGWGRTQTRTVLLDRAIDVLNAYFDGEEVAFDLPFQPFGTTFQRRVWQAMCEIPYGHTRTYGELAATAGGVARAVGVACGANPIPILIPCHRVVGGNGLGGYSGDGGVETKVALLRLEGALL